MKHNIQAVCFEESNGISPSENLIVAPVKAISPWEALNESQQLLATELADTQHQVTQMFSVLEQAVALLTASAHRPGGVGVEVLATGLAQRLLDLQNEMQGLREAIEHSPVQDAIGDRVSGLYEALKEELERASRERERSLRREIDRLLWILLGAAGVVTGGSLWMVLKP